MNDRPFEPFTDEDLARWVRRHPEVWHYARPDDTELDPAQVESIIESVLSGEHRARRARAGRKRRRLVFGGTVSVVVLGSAVGVAAIIAGRQPSTPEGGTLCRAAANLQADSIVLAAGVDPVEGCGQFWAEGLLGDNDGLAPPLAACITAEGIINVFPGPPDICLSLGLDPAEPDLSPENEAIIALKDALESTINLGECRPAAAAAEAAEEVIAQSGLQGWTVAFTPSPEPGRCGKVAIDSTTKTVTIFEVPGGTP